MVAGRTESVSETVKHLHRRIFNTAPLVLEIIRRQVANVMQPVRADQHAATMACAYNAYLAVVASPLLHVGLGYEMLLGGS